MNRSTNCAKPAPKAAIPPRCARASVKPSRIFCRSSKKWTPNSRPSPANGMPHSTPAPKCIPGPYGSNLCPSVVSVDPDGKIIVGEPARDRLLTQPDRTIYSVKRLMGRGVADVQDELKLFPFRIAPGSDSVIQVQLGEKTFTPPEISAYVLRQLKRNAEAHLQEPVTKAVITVP